MADVCGEPEIQRFNTFILHVSPFLYNPLCSFTALTPPFSPVFTVTPSLDGLGVTLTKPYLLLLLHLCSSGLCFFKRCHITSLKSLRLFFTTICVFKFRLRRHVKYNKIDASSVFLNDVYVITVLFLSSILRLDL